MKRLLALYWRLMSKVRACKSNPEFSLACSFFSESLSFLFILIIKLMHIHHRKRNNRIKG